MKIKLPKRLDAISCFVRDGRVVADIGTDHAYLPIALLESGRCKKAYASDIGEGPLERARANIEERGLSDVITPILTDGAAYFEGLADEFIIAGMGGELIFSIISLAEFLKNENIHMVLQPMTKVPFLRRSLLENGFVIDDETLVKEDGKLYTVLSVFYDGKVRKPSDIECLVGDIQRYKSSDKIGLFCDLLSLITHDLDNKIYGKREAGLSTVEENRLRREIQLLLKDVKGQNNENC